MRNAGKELARLTWCLTNRGYADARCDDGEKHDHFDMVVDYAHGTGNAKVLYRMDPVGTTYLLPDGGTVRLTKYEDDPFVEPPIEDKILPRYDWWSPMGGASGGLGLDNLDAIWDGPNLATGVRRVVPVAAPERPAVGSLYVRPNGEAWRIRGYVMGWDPEVGALRSEQVASYSIANLDGSQSSGMSNPLPDDAVLVWTP